MSFRAVRDWGVRLGLLGTTILVLAGCPERADEITEAASEPIFNFDVVSVFAPPGGPFAINNVVLAQIDTSQTNAFGREELTDLLDEGATFFSCGGPCPAWEPVMLNGSQDLRLPDLGDDDAAGFFGVTPESVFGIPFAVYTFAGLNPNVTYSFALERSALTVNEGLDHSNVLLDNPELAAVPPFLAVTNPDAPDELTPLGGTPGTTLGSNPYCIGADVSDGGGGIGFNFFVFTGTGNDDILSTGRTESFDLPQYNYIVVYESGDCTGTPVMRGQVGVDLDLNGNPVNNALGSFPTEPLTRSQMLAGPGGAGKPDSLRVTFSELEDLPAAEYTAWLTNPLTGSTVPAAGTYNRIKIIAERDPITGDIISTRDSIVETVAAVSGFVGGNQEDGFRHQLIIGAGSLVGGAQVGDHTDLILTIDSSPGDGTPGTATPLWFRYTDQRGTSDNFFDDAFRFSGTTSFGNFDTRVFNGAGFGLGGVRGDELSVDLQALSRPPIGYTFVGWLVPADGGTPFRMPDITGPPPARVNLVDADVDASPDVVTENGILDANFRVFASETGIQFANFASFVVTLEPKAGAASIGPLEVYSAPLPLDFISQ